MTSYILRIRSDLSAMTMATIPMDIIFTHIFPKLPAKSLLIFKCVCKSWQIYISSPKFITIHLDHSISSKNHLLILTTTHNALFSLPLDSSVESSAAGLQNKGEGRQVPHVAASLPLFTSTKDVRLVVGSCNGLICLNHYSQGLPIYVLNPCSGFYRDVPSLQLPRRPSAVNFGFGYDHVNGDYKVVRVMDYLPRMMVLGNVSRQVSVYSLRASKWRIVEWIVPFDCAKDGDNGAVLRNHLVHWLVWCFELRKCKIKCFDLCQEKWVDDVPMFGDDTANVVQESGPQKRDGVLDLGVFEGYLFVSKKKNEQISNEFNEIIDVWIMKEYGVRESWVKLLSVSDARITRSLRLSPVVYSNNGNTVLVRTERQSEHKLCWYNLEDESVEIAEFRGVGDCFGADVCIGSLVCVPGGHLFEKTKNDKKGDEETGIRE